MLFKLQFLLCVLLFLVTFLKVFDVLVPYGSVDREIQDPESFDPGPRLEEKRMEGLETTTYCTKLRWIVSHRDKPCPTEQGRLCNNRQNVRLENVRGNDGPVSRSKSLVCPSFGVLLTPVSLRDYDSKTSPESSTIHSCVREWR